MRVDENCATGGRGRARRVLLGFVAASTAVHATVLVVLPGFEHARDLPNAAVLEVVLLKAESSTAGTRELAARPLPRISSPERVPAEALPGLRHERIAPVLALSEPKLQETTSLAVESPGVNEPLSSRLETGLADSPVAAALPGASAAYLRNPTPLYPDAARRAGEQGTVTLRVRVARDGAALRVAVEKSSGSPHLDAAALEAVKAWRFAPARRGTDAVESWILVPIVFRLEGSSW